MDTWIEQHLGLSIEEAGFIVSAIALVLAALVFVPAVRGASQRVVGRLLMTSGYTTRRYARWFVTEYRDVRNIYLDREERLNLSSTYVSLSFFTEQRSGEHRVAAAQVLADAETRRALIVGDPGTGKSTLLKAYGIGILRGRSDRDGTDLKQVSRSREVPFLVSLRHLGRYLKDGGNLADYLIDEVLRKEAKLTAGRSLLQRLLQQKRCLVLLDGLDEVADPMYEDTRRAVFAFMTDEDPDLPTANARLILSCRRQNFLRFERDWVPGFASRPYLLAPLRDAEIFRFLTKRRHDFTAPRTPERFYQDVLASGTVDLHRVPLVLTISVGLYLHLTAYEIPHSIDRFYRAMIDELLHRHDFPTDPAAPKINVFNADDKFRYLRAFAHAMAVRDGDFEDFTFAEAVDFARTLPRMTRLRESDAEAFVVEIIDHSGLIKEVSAEDEYAFAHRSIQEYLVAVHLQRDARAAVPMLATHAADSKWRQVILFFAALDHAYVDDLVRAVAVRNLELAGHCVGTALVTDDVALSIVARLRQLVSTDSAYLWALIAAARAPRDTVRDVAVSEVADAINAVEVQQSLLSGLALDTDLAVRLLSALASADAARIATLVPVLAARAEASERLIGPLWRCLAAPGMEDEPATAEIVEYLLRLAQYEVGLEELQAQPRYQPQFVDENLRRLVYPFSRGHDSESNLVTLLCWARRTGAALPRGRFADASSDSTYFARLDRDERRSVSVSLFRPGQVLAYGGLGAALVLAVSLLVFDWDRYQSVGWWSLALFPTPGLIAFLLAGALAHVIEPLELSYDDVSNAIFGWVDEYFDGSSGDGYYWDSDTLQLGAVMTIFGSVYGVALAPLLEFGLLVYLLAAPALTWFAFYLPATALFDPNNRFYLRGRNPYLDVFQDPYSRRWVHPGS
jgi:hypothetical protein